MLHISINLLTYLNSEEHWKNEIYKLIKVTAAETNCLLTFARSEKAKMEKNKDWLFEIPINIHSAYPREINNAIMKLFHKWNIRWNTLFFRWKSSFETRPRSSPGSRKRWGYLFLFPMSLCSAKMLYAYMLHTISVFKISSSKFFKLKIPSTHVLGIHKASLLCVWHSFCRGKKL